MRRRKQLQHLAVGAALAGTVLAGCDWTPPPTLGLGNDTAPAAAVDDAGAAPAVAVDAPATEVDAAVEATPVDVAAPEAVSAEAVPADVAEVAVAAAPAPTFPFTELADLSQLPLPDLSQLGDLLAGSGLTIPGLDRLPDLTQVPLPDVGTRLDETFAALQTRFQDLFSGFVPQVPGSDPGATTATSEPTPAAASPATPELPDPSALATGLPDLAGLASAFGG